MTQGDEKAESTVLLISMLMLIKDLDRPFTGFVTIKPTLISQEAHDPAAQYQHTTPAPLPATATATRSSSKGPRPDPLSVSLALVAVAP
jgi:hypothetical protein